MGFARFTALSQQDLTNTASGRFTLSITKQNVLNTLLQHLWAFLLAQSVESACGAGEMGSTPGCGRCPGEGNGNPLQYSCWENSTNRGTWQAIVRWIAELDTTEQLTHTHTHTHTLISLFLSQWLLWMPDTSPFSLFCTQTIEWMGHMENFLEERVKTDGEQTAGWRVLRPEMQASLPAQNWSGICSSL